MRLKYKTEIHRKRHIETKKIKTKHEIGGVYYGKMFERRWGRQCVLSDLSSLDEFMKKQI